MPSKRPQRVIDLKGKVFGKLVVLNFDHMKENPSGGTSSVWNVGCIDCSHQFLIVRQNLVRSFKTVRKCPECIAKKGRQL